MVRHRRNHHSHQSISLSFYLEMVVLFFQIASLSLPYMFLESIYNRSKERFSNCKCYKKAGISFYAGVHPCITFLKPSWAATLNFFLFFNHAPEPTTLKWCKTQVPYEMAIHLFCVLCHALQQSTCRVSVVPGEGFDASYLVLFNRVLAYADYFILR